MVREIRVRLKGKKKSERKRKFMEGISSKIKEEKKYEDSADVSLGIRPRTKYARQESKLKRVAGSSSTEKACFGRDRTG